MNMMQRILKLMAQKYPENEFGFTVCLIIFDDGTGRIATGSQGRTLFDFDTLKELLAHLQEK